MLIFVDTLLVALSDPESLLQVSVQWWMVIDNYAEEPFLPEVNTEDSDHTNNDAVDTIENNEVGQVQEYSLHVRHHEQRGRVHGLLHL